jgi:hypothetical protein
MLKTILFFLVLSNSALALNPGDLLEEFSLKDQHENVSQVDASTKYLVFAKHKKASKIVEEAFRDTSKDYFPTKKLVYVADVSGMPGFVLSWFALPKMKKYPFRVLLEKEPDKTTVLPAKEGQVTVIFLDNLRVKKIEYYTEASSLSKTVEAF